MHVPYNRVRLLFVAVMCVLAAGLVLNVGVAAADPVGVSGEATWLTIDPAVNAALLDAGVLVRPLDPGTIEREWVDCTPTVLYSFPVTDGTIDPGTLAGTIAHSGGLVFINTASGASLAATDFRIDTAGAQLLGLVGTSYVPLLDLDLNAVRVRESWSALRLSNIGASLTEVAADALNASLGTDLFAGGLALGTAKTKLRVPGDGQTILCLDLPISQALAGAGLMALPVKSGEIWPIMPAWTNAPEGYLQECFSFPITGFRLDPATLAGRIWHGGGIRFYNAANGRSLKLTSFKIDTVDQVLSACVGWSRVPILDLDLSALAVEPPPAYGAIYQYPQGMYSVIGNVGVSLTPAAAMALNAKLKTDLFAPGLKIGNATVEIAL